MDAWNKSALSPYYKVDPLKTASFEFLMTDYTPRWTFYLVQDPRIPTG